jgi:nonribosomal peptide synthetase DhbF
LDYTVDCCCPIGEPKAVPITHASFHALFIGLRSRDQLSETDRVLDTTACSFDPHLSNVFCTLMIGATLVLAPHDAHLDTPALATIVERLGITHWDTVPALASSMADYVTLTSSQARIRSLRRIIVGGDVMHPSLLRTLRTVIHHDCVIWNAYGPTECTITASVHKCNARDALITTTVIPLGWLAMPFLGVVPRVINSCRSVR